MPSATAPRIINFQAHLFTLLGNERALVGRLMVVALLGAGLGLAVPYTSRVAIDSALPDSAPRLLVVVALGMLLLVLHQAWVSWLQSLSRIAICASLERDALGEVMRALLRSDYSLLRQRKSGAVMTTLSSASTVVKRQVELIVTVVSQGASSVAYFAVLVYASSGVAALVVAFNVAIAGVSYGLARFEANHTRTLLEQTSAEQQLLHTLMTGCIALRAMFATERLGASWTERVRDAGQTRVRVSRICAFLGTLKSAGAQVLNTGIMIWAVYYCLDGGTTIGGMTFLVSTSAGLSSSVMALIGVWTGGRGLRPHLERVDELLRAAPAQRAPSAPVLTSDEIVLENVSYRYPSGRWAVENRDLRVRRGSVYNLQSPSGSGKTTQLRLIAGLIPPARGRVCVFGVDPSRARELVLYVPQHCKLFEATIRENLEISSGRSLSEIAVVAKLTGLDAMLRRLPMGEETLVAAEGQNLSSGQRQLIVLTAAFASPRPVLLLDEATSQIDAQTRAAIRWNELCAGRTLICVEHG
jgi:ABC-type bacteriocin/lantibiotic exporter with double-glycine peptidase domain